MEKTSVPSTTKFMTLTREDPQFEAYLKGLGPKGYQVLPVESYAVHSPRERVTFSIKPQDSIPSTPILFRILTALRPSYLPLTLGPFILSLYTLWQWSVPLDGLKIILLGLSLVGLHTTSFALNDYNDHIQGLDRIQYRRGSQVIQRGWLTAQQMYFLALAGLGLTTLGGIYFLWTYPSHMILLGLIVLVFVLGFSFKGRGFKYQGVGDFIIGLCMGPLQTLAVGEILAPSQTLLLTLLGLPLGGMAALVFQLRQLEFILEERRTKTGTWVCRMGFDRSKKWIQFGLYIIPALIGFILLLCGTRQDVTVTLVFFLFLIQLPLQLRLKKTSSPLSSQLVGVSRQALIYHFLMIISLAIGLWINPSPS